MTVALLDASVWLARADPADPYHEPADRLAQAFVHGQAQAGALDLTMYEVANVAVRRRRSIQQARELVELIATVCAGRLASIDRRLADVAIALADEHGLSVYDAAYAACGRERGWLLVSGDGDLLRPGLAIAPADAVEQLGLSG